VKLGKVKQGRVRQGKATRRKAARIQLTPAEARELRLWEDII
jgi:hypothetical protein